jgi:hypothetical protein
MPASATSQPVYTPRQNAARLSPSTGYGSPAQSQANPLELKPMESADYAQTGVSRTHSAYRPCFQWFSLEKLAFFQQRVVLSTHSRLVPSGNRGFGALDGPARESRQTEASSGEHAGRKNFMPNEAGMQPEIINLLGAFLIRYRDLQAISCRRAGSGASNAEGWLRRRPECPSQQKWHEAPMTGRAFGLSSI